MPFAWPRASHFKMSQALSLLLSSLFSSAMYSGFFSVCAAYSYSALKRKNLDFFLSESKRRRSIAASCGQWVQRQIEKKLSSSSSWALF